MGLAVTQATMFNEDYPNIGRLVSDDERIPYFNPADATLTILPGEPVLVEMGGDQYLYIAQGPIPPGKTGYLIRRWTMSFPCDLSADVPEGTEIYWDPAEDAGSPVGTAMLEGDVTNGFRLGVATYVYDGHKNPTLDNDDKVICGTESSTRIVVLSLDGACPGKGTYEYSES